MLVYTSMDREQQDQSSTDILSGTCMLIEVLTMYQM